MPVIDQIESSKSSRMGKKVNGTLLLKVDAKKPEITKMKIAADVIRRGGLVAFPTETVYGLGADALNPAAVKRIFEAKNRPPDNPIIVHIANKEDIYRLAREVPNSVKKLVSQFWPGPLTLVLKRSRLVPDITVVGLDTIAVRMPDNRIALALIRVSGTPIAAPSANLAGKPSPTEAEHVVNDLAGRIEVVLDGGSAKVGVESTVIDMTVSPPCILRPGGTSYERLKRVLSGVEVHPAAAAVKKMRFSGARSPGMKHRHYAPNAEMTVVEGEFRQVEKRIQVLVDLHIAEGRKVGILATDESRSEYRGDVIKSLGSRNDVTAIAQNLFKILREFDKEDVDVIIVEGIVPRGLGLAVMNRLRRAADFNVIKVG